MSSEGQRVTDQIGAAEFHGAEGLEDWRVLAEGACAYFRTDSFAQSAGLVAAIGDLPSARAHPPAVDVRAGGVTVRLISAGGDYFGMTRRDVEVAREVSQLARKMGLAADPSRVQYLLVIPGATDIPGIRPFWRAVLGYEPRPDSPDEDLVDPQDRGPAFWLESMVSPDQVVGEPSTWACGCPMIRRRLGSLRPLRQVAGSCGTSSHRRGGRWPMLWATRRTSRRPAPATDAPGPRQPGCCRPRIDVDRLRSGARLVPGVSHAQPRLRRSRRRHREAKGAQSSGTWPRPFVPALEEA